MHTYFLEIECFANFLNFFFPSNLTNPRRALSFVLQNLVCLCCKLGLGRRPCNGENALRFCTLQSLWGKTYFLDNYDKSMLITISMNFGICFVEEWGIRMGF